MELSFEEHAFLGGVARRIADSVEQCFREPRPENAMALNRAVSMELGRAVDSYKLAGVPVGCEKGCSFCCYLRVSIYPYEAVGILAYMRARLPKERIVVLERKIIERAEEIAVLSEVEHYSRNIECAFLLNGECSIYEVRPSACAGYQSTSLEECRYSYEHPDDMDGEKPESREMALHYGAVNTGIVHGLMRCGLRSDRSEMHLLVAALLANQKNLKRWAAGKSVV